MQCKVLRSNILIPWSGVLLKISIFPVRNAVGSPAIAILLMMVELDISRHIVPGHCPQPWLTNALLHRLTIIKQILLPTHHSSEMLLDIPIPHRSSKLQFVIEIRNQIAYLVSSLRAMFAKQNNSNQKPFRYFDYKKLQAYCSRLLIFALIYRSMHCL